MKLITPSSKYRILAFFVFLVFTALIFWSLFIRMPGKSHRGPLPPLTDHEADLSLRLRDDVEKLSLYGERTPRRPRALADSASWIEAQFRAAGMPVERQSYEVHGKTFENLEAKLGPRESNKEVVVLGAHYDSVENCPGANDNASGVAALLALARILSAKAAPMAREIRFVAFTMEEYYFSTHHMGSMVYAKRCRDRGEKIRGMLSLETMGFYSEERGTQKYPLGALAYLYPSEGNFIAFVGNRASAPLVRFSVGSFRKHAHFPSAGLAAPDFVPGIGFSDHLSFWEQGYPALMVTDTAMFRYPHYHKASDTPDKIDFDRLARVVAGLEKVVEDLTN